MAINPISMVRWQRTTPAGQRLQYQQSSCGDSFVPCDSRGWAPCCQSIHGSYTLDANTLWSYLGASRWPESEYWTVAGICWLESNWQPDARAYCPVCCCQPPGVNALGLMQIYIEVHPQYSYNQLLTPLYNLNAAYDLYIQSGGYGPWPHAPADIQAAIANFPSQPTGQHVDISGPGTGPPTQPTTEPGVSLATDVINAPPPPQVTPPTPQFSFELPFQVAPPDYGKVDWEAIQRYYRDDIHNYTAYDEYLVGLLDALPGVPE